MGTAADLERTVVQRLDPLVGSVLDGRFHIDFQLAAGGFGAIYRATDIRADAEIALKVLLPQLARDANVVERFRREGKMLASLRDPHTITAYELGEAPDGTLYIVMELLHGVSLYERFRAQGRLPWSRVLHIARGVCSSLAEAHTLGIVHRDLKPANIHLEVRGNDPDFVKVLDFGIAKIVHGNAQDRTELTQAGQMIGTVDYMSPEQMVGGEMTPQSDIYSLGILMYEMISGRTPFAEAQTPTAILAAVLTQAPPLLSTHVDVPPALDHILARCLEREPVARFGEITELSDALVAVAAAAGDGDTCPARWRGHDRASTEVPTVPTSGFEEVVLTDAATRIDVRVTDSSEPVLDARGPRGWREPRRAQPPPVPPPRNPARAIQARGSDHGLDGRGMPPAVSAPEWGRGSIDARPAPGPRPALDSRGSQPMLEGAAVPPPPQAAIPHPYAPGAPYGYFQPHAEATPPAVPSYDRLAARRRDVMLRRIIWWLALFVVSTVVTLLATR